MHNYSELVYTTGMEKYKNTSIAVFLILNIFAIIFFVYQTSYKKEKGSDPSKVLPAKTSSDFSGTYETNLDLENYTIAYFRVDQVDKLSLIPNFHDSKTSNQIITDKKCNLLTNGGFYMAGSSQDKAIKPIGLFISNYDLISDFQKNKTLNGIFSINDFGTPRVTRITPSGNIKDGVQSGPILKENGSYTSAKLVNDSANRRILVGITGDNILYFMAIYQKDNAFSGPTIEHSKDILSNFELNKNISFADILNLDGGSASLMYFDSVTLPEARLAGSFFCLSN